MNEIDQAIYEIGKMSTAPDRETPDWMEQDIRRGIEWGLKNKKQFARKELEAVRDEIQEKSNEAYKKYHSFQHDTEDISNISAGKCIELLNTRIKSLEK